MAIHDTNSMSCIVKRECARNVCVSILDMLHRDTLTEQTS